MLEVALAVGPSPITLILRANDRGEIRLFVDILHADTAEELFDILSRASATADKALLDQEEVALLRLGIEFAVCGGQDRKRR